MTFFLNGPETPPKIKANAPQEDLPTWGEGLMAAGSSAQLENDSNFVAARRRIGVRDDMARDVVPRLGMDQIRPIIEERNAKAIEQGMPSQVVEIPDTVEEAVALLGPNFASKAIEMARSAAEADPDAWADIDLSDEAIETQTNERLRAEYEDAQQILEMMPGGRAAAEFVGGMGGITADVKNLPFLALGGGGGSIARVMGREAAINMGAEAAFLPSQFEMAERLGIPDPSVASQLAMAAGAGAILGGGVAAAQRGWSYYKGRNQTKPIGRMDQLRTQIMVDQTEDILTSDTAQPFEQIDRLVAEAGADIVVAHMGLTTKGAIGATTSLTLDESTDRVQAISDAARAINSEIIVLCHGGPISMPEDAEYVLQQTDGVDGFYGASSMERLPVETAMVDHIRRFKQIRF